MLRFAAIPQLARIRSRGHLPHWEFPRGTYFVTFRLAGSLPEHVLEQLRAKVGATALDGAHFHSSRRKSSSREIERLLDSGLGPKHLLRPEIADLVVGALHYFDGLRYQLFAWCVMPNHVHVVFKPLGEWDIAMIVRSWKSFTSHEVRTKFGIGTAFWQREYYDHLIRDDDEFARALRYVVENPAKAGLDGWRWVGVAPLGMAARGS